MAWRMAVGMESGSAVMVRSYPATTNEEPMPVERSIRDLPRNSPDGGWPPDEDPWLATAIVDWWAKTYKDKGALRAISTRQWRASWSLYRCDRQLAYALTDTTESNPPSIADKWRFWLGETIHEYFQHAVDDIFGVDWGGPAGARRRPGHHRDRRVAARRRRHAPPGTPAASWPSS
jgi:hypothetical protein